MEAGATYQRRQKNLHYMEKFNAIRTIINFK
jgi:hypothetical protein